MSDRTVVKTPAWTATLIQRDRDERQRYYSKTRIYDAPQTFARDAYDAYTHALVNDVDDATTRRLKRVMIREAREALRDALPQLLSYFSVNFHDLVTGTKFPNTESLRKLSYGDKAGCACGCSPAFVVEDDDRLRDLHGVAIDVWFTTTRPEIDITPETLRKAVNLSALEVSLILEELNV